MISVMRRDAGKAADFARRHGAKRWYCRAEELVADHEVNAVYVATPVSSHCEYAILAAEAGKHVLCEKPMAMNVEQCQRIMTACEQNSVRLMVAYYRRTWPIAKKMKALLAEGAIGDPMLVRINLGCYCNPSDFLEPANWRLQSEISGGGVMFDVGSHRLDLLGYLLGDVTQVAAFAETLHASYPVEDSVAAIMKLDCGAHAVANFNWNVNGYADEFEIYGTRGKLLARPLDAGHLEVHRGRDMETMELPPPKPTHIGLVEDFVRAVTEGTDVVCSGKDGMNTNLLMDAICRAACTGKVELLADRP